MKNKNKTQAVSSLTSHRLKPYGFYAQLDKMKLIKLDNYYLLSDENVEDNYIGYLFQNGELYASKQPTVIHTSSIRGSGHYGKEWKKVIASTEHLEGLLLLDKNQIESVLPTKEDVSLQSVIDKRNTTDRYDSFLKRYNYSEQDIKDIVNEYNESDKKFTLNEVNKIILDVFNKTEHTGEKVYHFYIDFKKTFSEYIKKITDLDVTIEMEQDGGFVISGGLNTVGEVGGNGLEEHCNYKPKVNEQGYITITSIK